MIALALMLAALASPDPGPSASPPTLGTITVEAGRETYVLTAADLRRLGAQTVGDAMRFVPGAVVVDFGQPGQLQTVALRGASSSETLVLLDGRSVNEPDTGPTDYSSLPLDAVDRIVVIEGGDSTKYGSAAVGGVVQIFTKTYVSQRDAAFVETGFQGVKYGVSMRAAAPGGLGVALDASSRRARNAFDYPAFGALAGGTRENDDVRGSDATLAVTHGFGRLGAALRLGDDVSDLGVPGSTQFGPSFVSAFARAQRRERRSEFDLSVAPAGRFQDLRASVWADGRSYHYYDPTPSFPFDTLVLATTRGYRLNAAYRAGASNLIELILEGHGDRELLEGTFYTPTDSVVTDGVTEWYAGDRYTARNGTTIVEAGVRQTRVQGFGATSLPSFSVRQDLGNAYALRAHYGRSYRAPNLDELYFPGFGNPKLQPEFAATFDVGVDGRWRGLRSSLSYFGTDVDNLIVNVATDAVGDFLPFNVSRAHVRGLSASTDADRGAWHARATYTDFLRAADQSATPDLNGVQVGGNRILYRPSATASAQLWHARGTAEEGADISFVGRRFADEENTIALPSYAALGAHVTRPVGRALMLTLRGDNLTGQRVQVEYGYPVLPPRLSVRLSWSR